MNFSELGVIPPLLKALDREWFSDATEVQEKVIPLAISWKDIFASARTGSGKTLAFALPTLNTLYNNRVKKWLVEWKINRNIQALILAPTRELAIQIWETFAPYSTNVNMKHTVIYGWVNQFHQVKAIEKWVEILVATPGRLEDLISQWVIKLSYVEIFILDEADRMLDMWSLSDIQKIIKRIPKSKQTLFFSATMPAKVKELSKEILSNPEHVTVHTTSTTTDTIIQKVYFINRSYKRQLLQQITKRAELSSIVVFVNTLDECEKVYEFVKSSGVKCSYINKNKKQNARQLALKALKDGDIKVLIATDIASRWLDISDLSCVVNYDLPLDSETYVHRIWRTARAWKDGLAISFCTNQDKEKLTKVEELIGQKLEVVKDDSYKDVIVPRGQSEKTKKINQKNKPRSKKKRHYWK